MRTKLLTGVVCGRGSDGNKSMGGVDRALLRANAFTFSFADDPEFPDRRVGSVPAR